MFYGVISGWAGRRISLRKDSCVFKAKQIASNSYEAFAIGDLFGHKQVIDLSKFLAKVKVFYIANLR